MTSLVSSLNMPVRHNEHYGTVMCAAATPQSRSRVTVSTCCEHKNAAGHANDRRFKQGPRGMNYPSVCCGIKVSADAIPWLPSMGCKGCILPLRRHMGCRDCMLLSWRRRMGCTHHRQLSWRLCMDCTGCRMHMPGRRRQPATGQLHQQQDPGQQEEQQRLTEVWICAFS